MCDNGQGDGLEPEESAPRTGSGGIGRRASKSANSVRNAPNCRKVSAYFGFRPGLLRSVGVLDPILDMGGSEAVRHV